MVIDGCCQSVYGGWEENTEVRKSGRPRVVMMMLDQGGGCIALCVLGASSMRARQIWESLGNGSKGNGRGAQRD